MTSNARARLAAFFAASLFFSALGGQSRAEEAPGEAELRAHASAIHVHGVDPLSARRFEPAMARRVLSGMLADPALEPRHANAAETLGAVGGPGAFEALRGFILAGEGEIGASAFGAKLAALEGMALLAERGDGAALAFLSGGLESEAWTSLAWTRGRYDGAERAALMRRACVAALGSSGRPEALERLLALAEAGALPAGWLDDLDEAIERCASRVEGFPAFPGFPSESRPAPVAGERGGSSGAGLRLHRVTIARHVDVPPEAFDEAKADRVLALGSLILQRVESANDVSCGVAFVREGPIQTFGTPGDGLDVLFTDADTDAVLALDYDIKIVNSLGRCGGGGTSTLVGCAPVGSETNLVVDLDMPDDFDQARIWIHEFGHNQGLPHAELFLVKRVMSPALTMTGGVEVLTFERDAYLGFGTLNAGEPFGPWPPQQALVVR